MARARKLYYDVRLTEADPDAVVAPTLTADRDGGLLDALAALNGNAGAGAKQRQELSVFFVPYRDEIDG